MPPKRVKEIEPTDRATRSKTTDKPAPNYTYPSEEEDSLEEYFNPNIDLASTGNLPRLPAHLLPPVERRSYSPTEFDSPTRAVDKTTHSTLFHSVLENSNMASDHESDNEGQANARLPAPTDIPPIVVPGMDPVMAAMFAMMQQNHAAQLQIMKDDMDRRDRQDEKERKEFIKQSEYNRRKDLEASQAQMQLIITQMANMNSARHEKPKASAAKIPPFDIENESESRIRNCYRCEKTNHGQQECYFKDKPCLNCDRIGHISTVCRTPKKNNSQNGQGQASGSANLVEGHLSTVSAKMSSTVATRCNVANTKGKLAQKYPPPEDLDTITVGLSFMQPGSKPFSMKILPDTGANVTAIDISHGQDIVLEKTSVILRVANGTVLDTLGTAECTFSRHGNTANELVYVVKGLTEPLLSRRMLKALNMLHQDWPHQNCSRSAASANNISNHGHEPQSQESRQSENQHEPKPRLPKIITGNPAFDNFANEYREDVSSETCTPMTDDSYHIEQKTKKPPELQVDVQ